MKENFSSGSKIIPFNLKPVHVGIILIILVNIRLFIPSISVNWDGKDEMWMYFRFIGSALRDGNFPDFFPNIVSGYPLGANVQAGVYNIFYLAAALAFPTTPYSVNSIFLITHGLIFLAAYRIGETYGFDAKTSLYIGLATIASGFLIGHASHMSYAAAGLGLMSCFLGVRIALGGEWRLPMVLVSIGVYHALTAGYPAITSFGGQLLLLYWVFQWINNPTERNSLYAVVLGALIGLAISLPATAHLLHQSENWSRGEGVDLASLAAGSLPLTSLVNFILPVLPSSFLAKLATAPPDITMIRFHLLIMSVAGVFVALLQLKSQPKRRMLAPWLLIVFFVTWLALGANVFPALRIWLAEHLFIYRLGRFPSGEHRGVALFVLVLISAVGVSHLLRKYPWFEKKFLILIIVDFLLIMMVNQKMRVGRIDGNFGMPVPVFKTIFVVEDQDLIDEPRICSQDNIADPKQLVDVIETQRDLLAPARFYWRGYTNLIDYRYERDFTGVRDVLCGPSRLYNWLTREPQAYRLELYSPGDIRIVIGESESIQGSMQLVWADYNDGYWGLKINGVEQDFSSGPAALRYFVAKPGDRVQMIYRGPLSRLFRE